MQAQAGCPRCHLPISPERRQASVVICDSCGFVISNSEAATHQATDRKVLTFTVGICLTLCAAFLQVAVWDSHALEVIPLKFKELLGTSSVTDLQRMADICMERQKLDCVERVYFKLGDRDINQLLKLGQMEMNRGRYYQAVQTYRKFFLKGGSDLKASYLFARALTQIGKADEAAKYYDYVLSAKPDALLQSAAVQSYVRLLADMNRPEQAKQTIARLRQFSQMAAYLMDDEWRKVQASGDPKLRDTASVQ